MALMGHIIDTGNGKLPPEWVVYAMVAAAVLLMLAATLVALHRYLY